MNALRMRIAMSSPPDLGVPFSWVTDSAPARPYFALYSHVTRHLNTLSYAQHHRVGVGFPEGPILLPFYADPKSRQLLPFYTELQLTTFTALPTHTFAKFCPRCLCERRCCPCCPCERRCCPCCPHKRRCCRCCPVVQNLIEAVKGAGKGRCGV